MAGNTCGRAGRAGRAAVGGPSRREFVRRAGAVGLSLAGLMLAGGVQSGSVRAQGEDWESTGLSAAASTLFTPASGALYARVEDGLMRSDDGGGTWRPVKLPADAGFVTVDPLDHDILYAQNGTGLHKSANGGTTWNLALPKRMERDGGPVSWDAILNMVVSPADHSRLYLMARVNSFQHRSFRSRDGGSTWEVGSEQTLTASLACRTPFMLGHEADPERLIQGAGCTKAAIEPLTVSKSDDLGATWDGLTRLQDPTHLVGWRGVNPARLYLAANMHRYVGPGTQTAFEGSTLQRSDDDGRSWVEVLNVMAGAAPESGDLGRIRALAYDPSRPDVVYIAIGHVAVSTDGGFTWSGVGRDPLSVHALALGIDGRNLYAATDAGVLRCRTA